MKNEKRRKTGKLLLVELCSHRLIVYSMYRVLSAFFIIYLFSHIFSNERINDTCTVQKNCNTHRRYVKFLNEKDF